MRMDFTIPDALMAQILTLSVVAIALAIVNPIVGTLTLEAMAAIVLIGLVVALPTTLTMAVCLWSVRLLMPSGNTAE